MRQNYKHEQDLEPNRWDSEEVHRNQRKCDCRETSARTVTADGGCGPCTSRPWLGICRGPVSTAHRGFAGVGPAHPLNYLSHLSVDLRSTDSLTALPSPVEPKALAMPCHHSPRLDNDQTRAPIGPESGQSDPELAHLQSGTRRNFPLQEAKLMPKSYDLQMQSGSRPKPARKRIEEREGEFTHDFWNIVPSEINFNANCSDAADKQAQMLSTVAPVYRWSVSRRPPLTGILGCFLCSSR
jgi:hypothetical protein